MRNLLGTLQMMALSVAAAALMAPTPAQAQRHDRGHRRNVVVCASIHQRTERCRVSWQDARLLRQQSKARCERGRSWGFQSGVIWVSDGCRGEFVEARGRGRDHDRDWQNRWSRDIRLTCGSHSYDYRMCRVDVGRHGKVVLVRQESSTRCVRGRNWGFNRAGVWVNQGCRAQFLIHRRW